MIIVLNWCIYRGVLPVTKRSIPIPISRHVRSTRFLRNATISAFHLIHHMQCIHITQKNPGFAPDVTLHQSTIRSNIHRDILQAHVQWNQIWMISEATIFFPCTTPILYVPVYAEHELHRQTILFHLGKLIQLGLILVKIKRVVMNSRDHPNCALVQTVCNDEMPQILLLARPLVYVSRLCWTVLPSDQKFSTCLRYQQLLRERFLQTHSCRNSSHPRIQQRLVATILHNLCLFHALNLNYLRWRVSSNFLFPHTPIPISNRRVENRMQICTV